VVVPLLWHGECANLLLTAERRNRVSVEGVRHQPDSSEIAS